MNSSDPSGLSHEEMELLTTLPRPKSQAPLQLSNVWIIEWLEEGEPSTGRRLHDWIEVIRPGWAAYRLCRSKDEVLAAIEAARNVSERKGMNPVLHIEAHGDEHGLEGPDGHGKRERLNWEEFIPSLERLNIATRCNLIVFFAACTGIAGLKVMAEGLRAPALAVIGPAGVIGSEHLLQASKAFYRGLKSGGNLTDIVNSAAEEGGQDFHVEPLMEMFYEVTTERMVRTLRTEEWQQQRARLKQKMLSQTDFDEKEIDRRLDNLPRFRPAEYQFVWDTRFMIDLYPDNLGRFGLDLYAIVALVEAKLTSTTNNGPITESNET